MRSRSIVLSFVLAFAGVTPLAAQNWESPTFFAPRPTEDLGLYFIFPEDSDVGFAGIWRQHGNLNLGVRVGYLPSDFDDYVTVGAELFGPLRLLGADSELLMAWLLGVGASFDGATLLRIPVGVSVGTLLGAGDNFILQPYVFPRVALDVISVDFDGEEETETDVNLAIDVGADAILSDRWVVRGGVTFDTSDWVPETTFGVGVAYRFGRRLVVR